MSTEELPPTSPSLLGQLVNPSESEGAWQTFLERYQPPITAWCRRLGLQDADAQEVTSDVLLRLAKALPTFRYDAGLQFRAWLRTVIRNAVRNYWRDRGRRVGIQGSGDSGVAELLDQVPGEAVEELVGHMDERLRADFVLAEAAAQRVQREVLACTWQAFWQTVIDGQPVPEVAARLGMSKASVYMARKRVGDRLREAAAELRQGRAE